MLHFGMLWSAGGVVMTIGFPGCIQDEKREDEECKKADMDGQRCESSTGHGDTDG